MFQTLIRCIGTPGVHASFSVRPPQRPLEINNLKSFVGFVMYIITKETIYYINLRQAYLTTPRNVARISTRVVLFTGVPEDYRLETWIKADFAGVKRVWYATDCTELEALVHNMNKTATNLEEAEIRLSTIATKKHLKGEKHFTEDAERADNATAQWIVPKERPFTRQIPLVGRKMDLVDYYREQLSTLIPKVQNLQEQHIAANVKLLPALFVEFETQRAAQAAYSVPFWNQPGKMEPACISIATPQEIIWANLAMGRLERWIRTFFANTLIFLLILFWSIPVGLVGALSDIESLADTFAPLGFINKLPLAVIGTISGLIPTILISVLLALVPVICRCKMQLCSAEIRYANINQDIAEKAGSVTLAQVELRVQGWYFFFQVVQVFLVTTFSSGAAKVASRSTSGLA
jgi:hypothetical protein